MISVKEYLLIENNSDESFILLKKIVKILKQFVHEIIFVDNCFVIEINIIPTSKIFIQIARRKKYKLITVLTNA